MYIYKNEHNRQQADDWLWDTIPNTHIIVKYLNKDFYLSFSIGMVWPIEKWRSIGGLPLG